jgi:hypothetical protein
MASGKTAPEGVSQEDYDDFTRELEGYDVVTEDEGYSIDFPELPKGVFKGVFKGTKIFQSPNLQTGELQDVTMLMFTDLNGERCNTWANYRLTEALGEGMTVGREVMIVWHGKEKIKDGAQELNRMSVYCKKQ